MSGICTCLVAGLGLYFAQFQTTAGLQRGAEDGVVKATSSLVDTGKVKKQSQLLKNAVKRKWVPYQSAQSYSGDPWKKVFFYCGSK